MSRELKTIKAKNAFSRNIMINQIFLSKFYAFAKNVVIEEIGDDVDLSDLMPGDVDFNSMTDFDHEHHRQLGNTPEDIGRNVLHLMKLEYQHEIDMEAIIREAGEKNIYGGFNLMSWDEIRGMKKDVLLGHVRRLVDQNHRNKPYGEHHDELIDSLRILSEHATVLICSTDQTRILYGSSGIRYISTGNERSVVRKSDQPQLSMSLLCGQNGKNKWSPGFVFREFSENKIENEIKLNLLHNNENPIDPEVLIFTQKTGSSIGKIQCQWNLKHFREMPEGPKLMYHDHCQPNLAWENQITMRQNNVDQRVCPSHMTGELAAPDDRYFNVLKNGNKHMNDVKHDFQNIYQSDEPYPKGPIIKNGIIKPLKPKLVIRVVLNAEHQIPDDLMFNSLHGCGNLLFAGLHGALELKSSLLRALLVDKATIALPGRLENDRNKTYEEILEIMKGMLINDQYDNEKKENLEMPREQLYSSTVHYAESTAGTYPSKLSILSPKQ